MDVVIETDRLVLREVSLEDTEDMFRLHSNELVQKYTEEETVKSKQEMEEAIRQRLQNYPLYGYGRWATFLKHNMQFVGWAGLAYLSEFDEIDLGYRFLPEFWGMGIATEAGRAILDYGFETLNLPRIIAIAVKENNASIRVMEKLDMTFEKYAPYEPGGKDVVWYASSNPNISKLKA